MPSNPTNNRTIYVKDAESFDKARSIAIAEGTTLSALISEFIHEYLKTRERFYGKVLAARKSL